MRIVIDLDGTICEVRRDPQTYADVKILPGAAEKIRKLKNEGHYIIIYSARQMKTHKGNMKKIIKITKPTAVRWLKNHKIPYDEIVFGKPFGHLYIDDLAHEFTSWDDKSLYKKLKTLSEHDS